MKHLLKYLFLFLIAWLFFNMNALYAQKLDSGSKKQLKNAERLKEDKKYEPALSLFNQLLEKYPENTDVLFGLAECQKQLKKYDEASSTYEDLIAVLEDRISLLDFSTSKKDTKKQQFFVGLKIQAKNKMKSCESLKTEAQKSYAAQHDKAREQRLRENKKPSPSKTPKSIKQPSTKTVERQNTKNVSTSSGPEELPFKPHKFNLNKGEILTDFIGLQSYNKSRQIKEIQGYVGDIYDSLDKSNNLYKYSYSDIMKVNYNWMQNIASKQYDWFENLKTKESKYRKIQDRYDSIVAVRKMLENDLKMSANDSALYAKKIDLNTKDSLRLTNFRDNVLPQELKSKLSTIPQSIVLVGRIKQTSSLRNPEQINSLIKAMTNVAIKEKNASAILSYKFSDNNDLHQMYNISSEGIAQTADKYYKTLREPFIHDLYLYEIFRLEVFPFNISSDEEKIINKHSTTKNIQSLFINDSLINIYEVKMENNNASGLIELVYDGVDFSQKNFSQFTTHKFKEEEIGFIKTISIYSQTFNDLYDTKLNDAVLKYNDEKIKSTKKIQLIAANNVALRKEAAEITKKTDSIRNAFNKLDKTRENVLQNDYQNAKKDYQAFYKTKYQSINQLVVKNARQLEQDYTSGFKDLVNECYQSINDNIQKRYSKTTIFKEVKEGRYTLKLEDAQVTYKPSIDSFQVLSMIIYEKGEDTYLALNMAFNVKWQLSDNTVRPPVNTITTNTKKEVSASNESKSNTEKQVDNNNLSGTKVAGDYGASWRLYLTEPSSLTTFLFDKTASSKWRLPTIGELEDILSNPDDLNTIKEKLNLVNTKPVLKKYMILPSNDKGWNDDNFMVYKSLRLFFNPFHYEPIDVMEGNLVYIILIKK